MTKYKSTNDNDNSATPLLARNSEDASSFNRGGNGRFKTYAIIGAAATLGAFGVLHHAAQSSSSMTTTMGRGGVRRARLGSVTIGSPQNLMLYTGCSPLEKLPFNKFGNWTGKMGAKVVTKSMSNDFLYETAQPMTEITCGNFEVTVDLAVGEEFGFYLHPIGDDTDINTVLDSGCLKEGNKRCPGFSTPSVLAGIENCTSKYTDPVSGEDFYNRVFDGTTLSYNWGTCETTCSKNPSFCNNPPPSSGSDRCVSTSDKECPPSSMISQNGQYELKAQVNGNLVVYDVANNNTVMWSSNSNGDDIPYTFELLKDGDLEIKDGSGFVVWKAFPEGGPGMPDSPYHLIMRNDGNLVIENRKEEVEWSALTPTK